LRKVKGQRNSSPACTNKAKMCTTVIGGDFERSV